MLEIDVVIPLLRQIPLTYSGRARIVSDNGQMGNLDHRIIGK